MEQVENEKKTEEPQAGEPPQEKQAAPQENEPAAPKPSPPGKSLEDIIRSEIADKFSDIRIEKVYGNFHLGDNFNFKPTEPNKTETPNKTYHLDDRKEAGAFVAEKKTSHILALAILLSVFQCVPFSELESLRASLYRLLPPNPDEEEDKRIKAAEAYMSFDVMLASIGAQEGEFDDVTKHETIVTPCVRLPNNTEVLKNFWLLFPSFREIILNWLLETIQNTSTFIYQQAATALFQIIKLDFSYGVNVIIKKLAENRRNYYTLFLIFQALYREELHEDELDGILDKWSRHRYLWRTAYLCSIHSYYAGSLHSMLQEKLADAAEDLERFESDVKFIGRSLHLSSLARDYAAEILNTLWKKQSKNGVAELYIFLVFHAYFTTSKQQPILPLVDCDSEEQLSALSPILIYIMKYRMKRTLLFQILSRHLEEFDTYQTDVTDGLIDYFIELVLSDRELYKKVLEFLTMETSATAKAIAACLEDVFKAATANQLEEGETTCIP